MRAPRNGHDLPGDERTVGVIVDPEHGARARSLAEEMPIWVVDSAGNRAVVEDLWRELRVRDGGGGDRVTIFTATAEAPDAVAVDILDDVLLHHAGVRGLRILGAPLSATLGEALLERGFVAVVDGDKIEARSRTP